MKLSPKFKIIILIVLFVLLFIFGAVGFFLLSMEYQKRETLERKIDGLLIDKDKIEQDLKLAQQEIDKLNNVLKESKDKIQLLSIQVDSENKAKKDLQYQLDGLNSQLNVEKETKSQLEKKVSILQGDIENFLARFKELEEEKSDMQAKIDQYEKQIELGTIVVDNGEQVSGAEMQTGTEITKLSGNIIKVNREHNFVVINIGQEQGISEGDIFSVYHAGKYVGDVEVEKAHPTLSAANFLPNLKTDLVRESDAVVKKD